MDYLRLPAKNFIFCRLSKIGHEPMEDGPFVREMIGRGDVGYVKPCYVNLLLKPHLQ